MKRNTLGKACRNRLLYLLLLLSPVFWASCRNTQEIRHVEDPLLGSKPVQVQAPVLVYKTSRPYDRQVPVLMNEEKTRIVAYPDPSDLVVNGKFTLPTPLAKGYLLDNRGIGRNVAFLTYTYETYAQLSRVPDLQQLQDSILDRNPLTELWNCGAKIRFKDQIHELNALIEKGFPGCTSLVGPSPQSTMP